MSFYFLKNSELRFFSYPIYKGTYLYREKIFLRDGQAPPPDKEVHIQRTQNPLLPGSFIVKRYYIEEEVYKDFVEAIVPEDLWEAVQGQRQRRPRKGEAWPENIRTARDGTAQAHLLSGLCYCAHCQGIMYATTRFHRPKYVYLTYECSTRVREGPSGCEFNRINAVALEPAVIDWLYSFVDPDFMAEFVERLNEYFASVKPDDKLEKYIREVAELKRKRMNLLEFITEGDEEAKEFYRQLGQKLSQAETEMKRLSVAGPYQPIRVDHKDVLSILDTIKVSLDSPDVETRRRALREVGSESRCRLARNRILCEHCTECDALIR